MNSAQTKSMQWSRSDISLSMFERAARRLVLGMLEKLQHGRIFLIEDNVRSTYGQESDKKSLSVEIRVKDPKFYTKVAFGGSIGAGEAYIYGLYDCSNLTTLVTILAVNMEAMGELEKRFGWFVKPFTKVFHALRPNTRKGSKKNIMAHYDLGNEMYETFLDPTMMYSSAIYGDDQMSLEDASLHKLQRICEQLELTKDDHLVEIGTGWGGFAIYAAKNYGCHVTTTTISDAQFEEAKKRVEAAGLDDKITLLKEDYRNLTGQYDKLVSIEMIEAVGDKYHPVFFAKCNELLKDGGRMVLQAITIKDQNYDAYVHSVDFIQRHVFPGGCLLSNKRMVDLIAQETQMVVTALSDFGLHYAKTLHHWRERFMQAKVEIEGLGYDERFRRLWEFYLCYCEGGFLARSISVVHLTAEKPVAGTVGS